MRQIREYLRQVGPRLSHREVARSEGLSCGAVGTTVLRARAAGLDWVQVGTLTDAALEARLYGRPEVAGSRGRPTPTSRTCTSSIASRASPWSCTANSWCCRSLIQGAAVPKSPQECDDG